jgi:hypothetical protein
MKQIEQSLNVSNKIKSRAVLTTTKTQQQQQQAQEQNLCNINSNDIKQQSSSLTLSDQLVFQDFNTSQKSPESK